MEKKWVALITALVLAAGLTACGSKDEKAVPVQSVAMLAGLTDAMQAQRFAGVVSAGKEQSIKKDSGRKVAKVNVKKGDVVKAGDVLFTYDADSAKNSLDKAKLELEELRNTLTSKQEEINQLKKDKTKASANNQLDYTLKIQEAETDVRETQYNIGLKQKEIQAYEAQTKDLDVTAPFAGRIEYAGEADTSIASADAFGNDTASDAGDAGDITADTSGTGADGDSSGAFIKLIEIDNYRIKGTFNEQNRSDIAKGQIMKIYSRVDSSQTWSGEVSEVITTSTASTSSDNQIMMDTGTNDPSVTSSKYTFYVTLDDLDGLMIGQHVYMTVDDGTIEDGKIRLSSGYINDADSSPWVWAEGKNGTLAKKNVKLGDYDSGKDTYVIESSLTENDYIAYPSDSYSEGMTVTENDESSFNTGSDAEGLADMSGVDFTSEIETVGDGIDAVDEGNADAADEGDADDGADAGAVIGGVDAGEGAVG